MSLMEESANAELQGRPGGARRCVRSAAGHWRGNLEKARGREGDATRGPGSTSTHLNFGHSQGQCGRTIRPSLLLPSSPSPRLVSFLLVRASNSLCLSFSRLLSFPPPSLPPFDGVRTALSRHTVLGPTPSPVPSQVLFFFFFFFLARTNLRSCEIPISGDTRVIERRRIA